MAGWVSPDSYNNPNNWYAEANSIDSNTTTYSTSSGANFTEFLVLTKTVAVTSTKIRVWIAQDPKESTPSTDVQIDTSPDGSSWDNIKDGAVLNGNLSGWQEITFSSRTVKAIRFKRKSETAIYVYEAMIYDETTTPEASVSGAYHATKLSRLSGGL